MLTAQVIYVGGGCGTVGSGIVRDLLSNGAIVYVSSRSEENIKNLVESIDKKMRTCLHTYKLDILNENECIQLRDTILQNEGKINHTICALGSWWDKGTLSDQSLDEFYQVISGIAATHFVIFKTFAKVLSKQSNSSHTFVTGEMGDNCLIPEISLLTVADSTVYGIYNAAVAEYSDNTNFKINQIRFNMWIRNKLDYEFDPDTSNDQVGNDWSAKIVTKILLKHEGGIVKIANRKEGDAYCKTL